MQNRQLDKKQKADGKTGARSINFLKMAAIFFNDAWGRFRMLPENWLMQEKKCSLKYEKGFDNKKCSAIL